MKATVVLLGLMMLIPIFSVNALAVETDGYAYFVNDPYQVGGVIDIYYVKGAGSYALTRIDLYDPTGALKTSWTTFSTQGHKTYTSPVSINSIGDGTDQNQQWHLKYTTAGYIGHDYAQMWTEYAEFTSTPYAVGGSVDIAWKHWAIGTMSISLSRWSTQYGMYISVWSWGPHSAKTPTPPTVGHDTIGLVYSGLYKMDVTTTNHGSWTRTTTVGDNTVDVGGLYGSLNSDRISIKYSNAAGSMTVKLFGPTSTSTPIAQWSNLPYNYPNYAYLNYSLISGSGVTAGMYHVRATPTSGYQRDINVQVGYVTVPYSSCGQTMNPGSTATALARQVIHPSTGVLLGGLSVSLNMTQFYLRPIGGYGSIPDLLLDVGSGCSSTNNLEHGVNPKFYMTDEYVYIERVNTFDPGVWVAEDYGSPSGRISSAIDWQDTTGNFIEVNCTPYHDDESFIHAIAPQLLLTTITWVGGIMFTLATAGAGAPVAAAITYQTIVAWGSFVLRAAMMNQPISDAVHDVAVGDNGDNKASMHWVGDKERHGPGPFYTYTNYNNYSNNQWADCILTTQTSYAFRVYSVTTLWGFNGYWHDPIDGSWDPLYWIMDPITSPYIYVCVTN